MGGTKKVTAAKQKRIKEQKMQRIQKRVEKTREKADHVKQRLQ